MFDEKFMLGVKTITDYIFIYEYIKSVEMYNQIRELYLKRNAGTVLTAGHVPLETLYETTRSIMDQLETLKYSCWITDEEIKAFKERLDGK